MSRNKKYIEVLTAEEEAALKSGHKLGTQYQFRNRCECILLSNARYDVPALSIRFKVCERTIYVWLSTWENGGIEGLRNSPGQGRKPKLNKDDAEQVLKIKELIKNENQNLNQIVGHIEETMSVQLSKKTLIRFLKKT